VVAHLLDAAGEAVDGDVAAAFGGGELAVVGGEGVVLSRQGGVFFFDFLKFLHGQLVLLGGLVVFVLEGLVLAERDARCEGEGG